MQLLMKLMRGGQLNSFGRQKPAKTEACQCCLPSLCWSMLLLAVFMCMGALIMGRLAQGLKKPTGH